MGKNVSKSSLARVNQDSDYHIFEDFAYYPEPLRLVRYWDEEQKLELVFLTNAMHITALQVAELYKNRWQVELFFKWLMQHLRIKKKFWGTTENAVRIQIYTAICTYCLVVSRKTCN